MSWLSAVARFGSNSHAVLLTVQDRLKRGGKEGRQACLEAAAACQGDSTDSQDEQEPWQCCEPRRRGSPVWGRLPSPV